MKGNKILTYGLIVTFGLLYFCTAFVSFYHAIEFFQLANETWLSIILSLVAEIGQASVLFSLLMSNDRNKILPWIIMFILTGLQVIGNVFSCYSFIEEAASPKFLYFQKSILFFIEEAPETMKVIVAWIVGSILPIIALSMTSLVENNIADLYKMNKKENDEDIINDKIQEVNTDDEIKNDDVILTNDNKENKNSFEEELVPVEEIKHIKDPIINESDEFNTKEKNIVTDESISKVLEEFDKITIDADASINNKVNNVEVVSVK